MTQKRAASGEEKKTKTKKSKRAQKKTPNEIFIPSLSNLSLSHLIKN